MKQIRYTGLLIIYMVLLILPALPVLSQEKGKPAVAAEVKDNGSHSLFAGPGFASNMNYLGTALTQNEPSVSFSAIYGFREKLYLTVTANHLFSFSQLFTFSTASLGYYHDFNTWFDMSVSLSGYGVNSELQDTLFDNFLCSTLSGGVDWRVLYTSMSLTTVFSESSQNYFQIRNSRYFSIKNIFGSNADISFDPYISLMFGTMIKTETTDGTIIGVSVPFRSPKPQGQGTNDSSSFIGMIEADLGVPVGIESGKFYVEAEPGLVIPAYEDNNQQSAKGFSMYISLFYRIF